MPADNEKIVSCIWGEQAQENNPYCATKSLVAGYDVFGDLLGKVQWIEYLYLLFQQSAPSADQRKLLNDLAVAIACAGPRDHATQAAMSAAAGGSTLAACLMSALAVGAGRLGGGQEVLHGMHAWQENGNDMGKWVNFIKQPWPQPSHSIWPEAEHPFGFDPYNKECAAAVTQTLTCLANNNSAYYLKWLVSVKLELEAAAGRPISLVGVTSCAFYDLGFHPQQGEMLYLLLRLPGAAALAMEQHWRGWRDYPFHHDGFHLMNDPNTVCDMT